MQGIRATRNNNRTLAASSLGGGTPNGVSSGPIHLKTWAGPVVHTGQPHQISAHSIICLLRGRSTQPIGGSASTAPGRYRQHFLLTNFHRHGCLVRQSLSVGGKQRQLAFCPYHGIINENADTAFSHVRKHLDLLFVCGACHAKSYVNGHALQRHMTYQCVSAMAILAKPKSSRR